MESNFVKHTSNPVFGGPALGTCFDVYVTRMDDRYRMDFSWRPKRALAVTFSDDGIHWEEPRITLESDPTTGWEDNINRHCVLKIGDLYKMWYTGQARGHSYIGYAESTDGIRFSRPLREPVLIPEYPYEGMSVMNPCVIYEDGRYRMWYSAGETYEPNVIAYAESADGLTWTKSRINPIFTRNEQNVFEQDRIGGCQVVRTDDMGYLLFYIGYEDIDTARICVAKSPDGITRFERSPLNPLVEPTAGAWDSEATYKPTVVYDEACCRWMLWYNGRTGTKEYMGYAYFDGRDLFPKE